MTKHDSGEARGSKLENTKSKVKLDFRKPPEQSLGIQAIVAVWVMSYMRVSYLSLFAPIMLFHAMPPASLLRSVEDAIEI